jgi:hypothetical protein
MWVPSSIFSQIHTRFQLAIAKKEMLGEKKEGF